MSVATLYDVHGNLAALAAVLAEIPEDATIVVGGDVCTGGGQPAETLERLRGLGGRVRWLRGNADRALTPGEEEALPPQSREALARTRAALSGEQVGFLHGNPPTVRIRDVLYCHATPRNDVDVFTVATPEEQVAPAFAGVHDTVVVCGHTHLQFERTIAGIRVVNSGSVGNPYEDEPGAYWTLDLVHRRTPYQGAPPPQMGRDEAIALFDRLPSEPELVPVGRVGRPHGLDGSFFVERASEREGTFAAGATLFAAGEPAEVVVSKRGAGGRPVIRLDRRVPRGTELAVPREALPPLAEEDEFYVFQLVGLAVEEEDGRMLGRVSDVLEYPANDVLELDSGASLPLVGACVRQVDLAGGRIVVAPGFAEPD